MEPEKAVEVKNITKIFSLEKKQGFFGKMKKNLTSSSNNYLKALDNVSFTANKGEVLGIIGLNGSGKTTLMHIISGVYQPNSGCVNVNGTMAPILSIGTGFQPELIARENIIIYGMLLGFSKLEIQSKVDRILEFAELEQFSTLRLKHFSSGMKARLAVSTIFQLNPDIFLVDEIMAVGDLRFKEKCYETFLSLRKKGKTILYTTHNLAVLPEFCDRVLLLHKGKILSIGKPKEVIEKFKELNQSLN